MATAAETQKNEKIMAIVGALAIVGAFWFGTNKWGIKMLDIPAKTA